MTAYAKGTEVTAERSRAEIDQMMQRFGADQFVTGWDANRAMIGFTVNGRMVRLYLPMPARDDEEFAVTATGRARTEAAAREAYNAEVRRRWRSLALVIKAKLAAVEDGISTIEREFLSDLVLPNGSTVGDWVAPQIANSYKHATMPALLPGGAP